MGEEDDVSLGHDLDPTWFYPKGWKRYFDGSHPLDRFSDQIFIYQHNLLGGVMMNLDRTSFYVPRQDWVYSKSDKGSDQFFSGISTVPPKDKADLHRFKDYWNPADKAFPSRVLQHIANGQIHEMRQSNPIAMNSRYQAESSYASAQAYIFHLNVNRTRDADIRADYERLGGVMRSWFKEKGITLPKHWQLSDLPDTAGIKLSEWPTISRSLLKSDAWFGSKAPSELARSYKSSIERNFWGARYSDSSVAFRDQIEAVFAHVSDETDRHSQVKRVERAAFFLGDKTVEEHDPSRESIYEYVNRIAQTGRQEILDFWREQQRELANARPTSDVKDVGSYYGFVKDLRQRLEQNPEAQYLLAERGLNAVIIPSPRYHKPEGSTEWVPDSNLELEWYGRIMNRNDHRIEQAIKSGKVMLAGGLANSRDNVIVMNGNSLGTFREEVSHMMDYWVAREAGLPKDKASHFSHTLLFDADRAKDLAHAQRTVYQSYPVADGKLEPHPQFASDVKELLSRGVGHKQTLEDLRLHYVQPPGEMETMHGSIPYPTKAERISSEHALFDRTLQIITGDIIRTIDDVYNLPAKVYEDVRKSTDDQHGLNAGRDTETMVKFHRLRMRIEDQLASHTSRGSGEYRLFATAKEYYSVDPNSPALQILARAAPELTRAYREQWLPAVNIVANVKDPALRKVLLMAHIEQRDDSGQVTEKAGVINPDELARIQQINPDALRVAGIGLKKAGATAAKADEQPEAGSHIVVGDQQIPVEVKADAQRDKAAPAP